MTNQEPACHVVLLTPPGRGAVASLMVEGQGAGLRVEQLFRAASGRPAGQLVFNRITFGRWRSMDGAVEEVVVCRRGPERFEIHCHGGLAAAHAITQTLIDAGCCQLDWQTWLRNQCRDPTEAEARVALAEARTERTARVLLDQHGGALTQAIKRIVHELAMSHEAEALQYTNELLKWSRFGLHLTTPWHVVLAGPPNVGKSSLINALAGYQRAIVFETPGTTRDAVTATTAMDGWPVELVDTAGLRRSSDAVEVAGIAETRRRIEQADLVCLVLDLSCPWSADDTYRLAGQGESLTVLNKCDLVDGRPENGAAGLLTSAVTGAGILQLIDRIRIRLVPEVPPPGTAVPFAPKQIGILSACRDAITNGRGSAAAELLRQLLPPTSPVG